MTTNRNKIKPNTNQRSNVLTRDTRLFHVVSERCVADGESTPSIKFEFERKRWFNAFRLVCAVIEIVWFISPGETARTGMACAASNLSNHSTLGASTRAAVGVWVKTAKADLSEGCACD